MSISIITPVYNVEQYIQYSVESILNQTYQDIELILVDDGSTDRSGAMCDAFAKQDERVRVIHQENQGQAAARNHALDIAKGEYIAFVDSDDYIHPRTYEILMRNMLEHQATISVGGYQTVFSHDEPFSIETGDAALWNGKDFLKHCLFDKVDKKCWVLWDKVFHRSCFENIRLPEGRIYEDNAVVYKILYDAEKVVDCDAPLYYYYQNSESTVNQSFKLKHLDWLTVLEEMLVFFEEKEERELFDKINKTYLFSLAELHKKTKELLNEPEAEMVLLEKLRRQYRIEKRKYPISMKTHPWLYDELYPLYAKIYWKLHR